VYSLWPRYASVLGRECEADAAPLTVDTDDRHINHISDADDLLRIADEFSPHLADVDQAVLLDTDIHECPKVYDVADGALEDHALAEVLDA